MDLSNTSWSFKRLLEPKEFTCSITNVFSASQLLSQFISPHTGRIYGRHITGEQLHAEELRQRRFLFCGSFHVVSLCFTGLCGRKQREVSKAIKKAHSMGTFPLEWCFILSVSFYISSDKTPVQPWTAWDIKIWSDQNFYMYTLVSKRWGHPIRCSSMFLVGCSVAAPDLWNISRLLKCWSPCLRPISVHWLSIRVLTF